MKLILNVLILGILTLGCANTHCRDQKSATTVEAAAAKIQEKTSVSEKVKVYKVDGSLQCGMGKAISVQEMQKEFGTLPVYKAENKNDGMMRIQVCGSPTGQCNVFEIDRKNLDAAIKLGFKEWLF